jgi:nucleotide-binding universal stress UspA family protein
LKKIASRAEAAGVSVDVVVRPGEVDLTIESLITKRGMDFLVMGTHGRRGLEKLVLGSTTERLLRKLHIPVLTIGNVRSRFEPSAIRHLLMTTDLLEGTPDAATYAFGIGRQCGAKVTLLHVLNDLEADFSGRYRDRLMRSIGRELVDLIPNGLRHSGAAEVRVERGRPAQRILSFLKKEKVDLIVMNIHGKTLLDRIAIGSTAEKVVRTAGVPVLVIPPVTAAGRKRRTSRRAA